MNALTTRLLAKELHQHGALMTAATAAGLAALPLALTGSAGFHVAFVVWLTAVIALGVMLAMFGVSNERKERARLFVLSLPLSPLDYVRIKLLGLVACFALPWVVLSAGAVALVVALPGLADGLLPYTVLLCVYLLLNYAVVLSAALHIASEAGMGGVIILTNMSVSLFLAGVGRLPGIGEHMGAAAPVWTATFWLLLAAELAATLLALCLPLFFAARRRDAL